MATDTSRRVWSDLAIHPGELLAEEVETRELDIDSFATELGMLPTELRSVLQQETPITARLALALEKAWETDAVLWMNLQTAYDLTLARNAAAALPH